MFFKKEFSKLYISVLPITYSLQAHDSKSFLMNIHAKYKNKNCNNRKRLRKNGSQFHPGGIQIKTYELFP